MKINLKINKMMIKKNKQLYFDVSFRYSRASWGVLGCLGVSWGNINKTDPRLRSGGIYNFVHLFKSTPHTHLIPIDWTWHPGEVLSFWRFTSKLF